MSSTFVQNFNLIGDDHKKLSIFKKTNFKIEAKILNSCIFFNANPNGMKFFPHM
jgi:hypothetical protein